MKNNLLKINPSFPAGNKFKGISLGMISTIIWGTFYPISRALFGFDEGDVDALNFSVLRFSLAAIFLSFVFLRRENRIQTADMLRHHWKVVLLLSVVGIVGEGILVFWALQYTTSARASLMANTSPIQTVLISYLVGKELLTKNKLIGAILGLIGLVLFFTSNGQDMFTADTSTIIGDIMALASGFCWSVYTVYGDEIAKKYGDALCSEILFLVGLCVMIPMAIIKNGGITLALPWRVWLGALYLGVVSYGIANCLWYRALKFVTPGELGSLGFLSATLSVVLSIILLKERLSMAMITAIALVLLGVGLMLRKQKE
ncbi:MAG: EamA family transporter [Victivallales bacterium]|nr:EamA family transporter [Victivallales bacterium]